jgi:hypothetical protein
LRLYAVASLRQLIREYDLIIYPLHRRAVQSAHQAATAALPAHPIVDKSKKIFPEC